MKKDSKKQNNKLLSKIKKVYNKKIVNNKTKFNFKEITIYMLVSFGFGLIIGGIVMYGKGGFKSSSLALNEFISVYDEISSSYYQDVDDDELLENGIKGMIRYLGDPYSSYMDSNVAADFNEDVDGIYQGIGAEVKFDGEKVIINRVFDDSPAKKAGLKENDILIKVNGESIEGYSLNKVSSIVKGEKNTTVNLTIVRDGKELNLDVKRDEVDSVSVTSELIERDDKKIGYLYISIFASNTSKQFEKELKALEEKGIDALVIDVRNNQGGYLTTVTDIISLFIEKGKAIYQLKTKDDIEIVKDKTKEKREYPVVILANSSSASASEVLIGALKESYGATIVGTKTFGKGKVQKVMTLSNGAMYKYTYQEWVTPDGNYIDEVGIEPDVEIMYEYDEKKPDNQKEKAIEVLLSK